MGKLPDVGYVPGPPCCYFRSVCHIGVGLSLIRLSVYALTTVVGVSSPQAWDVGGAYTTKTAVVVSPLRGGVSLAFPNNAGPARTAVVLAPPRCWLPWCTERGRQWSSCRCLAGFRWRSQKVWWAQRGWRWCACCLCWPIAAVVGLVRECAGSDDGGGVLAASLLPLMMDLGSVVGVGPVRTAVGFSPPRSGAPRPCRRVCTERGRRWWFRRLVVRFPWCSQTAWVQ